MINEVNFFNGERMMVEVVGDNGVESIKVKDGVINIIRDGKTLAITTPYFVTVIENEQADNEEYKEDFSF